MRHKTTWWFQVDSYTHRVSAWDSRGNEYEIHKVKIEHCTINPHLTCSMPGMCDFSVSLIQQLLYWRLLCPTISSHLCITLQGIGCHWEWEEISYVRGKKALGSCAQWSWPQGSHSPISWFTPGLSMKMCVLLLCLDFILNFLSLLRKKKNKDFGLWRENPFWDWSFQSAACLW